MDTSGKLGDSVVSSISCVTVGNREQVPQKSLNESSNSVSKEKSSTVSELTIEVPMADSGYSSARPSDTSSEVETPDIFTPGMEKSNEELKTSDTNAFDFTIDEEFPALTTVVATRIAEPAAVSYSEMLRKNIKKAYKIYYNDVTTTEVLQKICPDNPTYIQKNNSIVPDKRFNATLYSEHEKVEVEQVIEKSDEKIVDLEENQIIDRNSSGLEAEIETVATLIETHTTADFNDWARQANIQEEDILNFERYYSAYAVVGQNYDPNEEPPGLEISSPGLIQVSDLQLEDTPIQELIRDNVPEERKYGSENSDCVLNDRSADANLLDEENSTNFQVRKPETVNSTCDSCPKEVALNEELGVIEQETRIMIPRTRSAYVESREVRSINEDHPDGSHYEHEDNKTVTEYETAKEHPETENGSENEVYYEAEDCLDYKEDDSLEPSIMTLSSWTYDGQGCFYQHMPEEDDKFCDDKASIQGNCGCSNTNSFVAKDDRQATDNTICHNFYYEIAPTKVVDNNNLRISTPLLTMQNGPDNNRLLEWPPRDMTTPPLSTLNGTIEVYATNTIPRRRVRRQVYPKNPAEAFSQIQKKKEQIKKIETDSEQVADTSNSSLNTTVAGSQVTASGDSRYVVVTAAIRNPVATITEEPNHAATVTARASATTSSTDKAREVMPLTVQHSTHEVNIARLCPRVQISPPTKPRKDMKPTSVELSKAKLAVLNSIKITNKTSTSTNVRGILRLPMPHQNQVEPSPNEPPAKPVIFQGPSRQSKNAIAITVKEPEPPTLAPKNSCSTIPAAKPNQNALAVKEQLNITEPSPTNSSAIKLNQKRNVNANGDAQSGKKSRKNKPVQNQGFTGALTLSEFPPLVKEKKEQNAVSIRFPSNVSVVQAAETNNNDTVRPKTNAFNNTAVRFRRNSNVSNSSFHNQSAGLLPFAINNFNASTNNNRVNHTANYNCQAPGLLPLPVGLPGQQRHIPNNFTIQTRPSAARNDTQPKLENLSIKITCSFADNHPQQPVYNGRPPMMLSNRPMNEHHNWLNMHSIIPRQSPFMNGAPLPPVQLPAYTPRRPSLEEFQYHMLNSLAPGGFPLHQELRRF